MTENGNTVIKNTIFTTDKEAQYDEKAKEILGQKRILAHILVKTVEEFKGMDPAKVVSFIEGDPYISIIPINSGQTNAIIAHSGEKITGLNTENKEINEGEIRFDILFYVRTCNGLCKIIINVEAQKDEPTEYDILNRAIFYTSRLVSSQKNREFMNSDYNNIKQVYSIWICMNRKKNTLEHIHLTKDSLIESDNWKGRMDLINIVMIGLAKDVPHREKKYELHRLLGTLFSQKLEACEKTQIIEKEYYIPMEQKFREDLKIMCNLSQGIKEAGHRAGVEQGKLETTEFMTNMFIHNMHKKGYSITQIADVLEIESSEVERRLS